MIKPILKNTAVLLTGVVIGSSVLYVSKKVDIEKGVKHLEKTAIEQHNYAEGNKKLATNLQKELERINTTTIPSKNKQIEELSKKVVELEEALKNKPSNEAIKNLEEEVKKANLEQTEILTTVNNAVANVNKAIGK